MLKTLAHLTAQPVYPTADDIASHERTAAAVAHFDLLYYCDEYYFTLLLAMQMHPW